METDYIIVSAPEYICFDCPHCHEEDVEVAFKNVNYKTSYWDDGGWCICPECGKRVELGNYEYD